MGACTDSFRCGRTGTKRWQRTVIRFGARVGRKDNGVSMERVTLITGATKGIGLACAEALVARGHRVVGIARHADGNAFPGELHVVDAGDRDAMAAAVETLANAHAFNGLVNNVGFVTPQPLGSVDLDA